MSVCKITLSLKKNVLDEDLKWMWLKVHREWERERKRDKALPKKGINILFMQRYVDALNQREREKEKTKEWEIDSKP